MADNKKSFVLYADLIHTVRKMPKSKRGDLLMTILEYVNDENPTVSDMVVDLVFEPIKHQLKRDLKRWEQFKVRQSENGAKGGRPKKTDNETVENPKNPSLYLESQKSLNVTVNDTVNVIDDPQSIFSIEDCLTIALKDNRWVNANKVLLKDLDQFNKLLEQRAIYTKNPADYKTHYSNWNRGGRKEIIEPERTGPSYREAQGKKLLDSL